jgi:hypothetical protein
MQTINRSALVVKPAQPFLEWLHQVDPASADLTLDDLRDEPTIYLISECESEKETIEYLRELCNAIFEEQLNDWYRVPSAWPQTRDWPAFRRWFDWSLHSMVIDVSEDPIAREAIC